MGFRRATPTAFTTVFARRRALGPAPFALVTARRFVTRFILADDAPNREPRTLIATRGTRVMMWMVMATRPVRDALIGVCAGGRREVALTGEVPAMGFALLLRARPVFATSSPTIDVMWGVRTGTVNVMNLICHGCCKLFRVTSTVGARR